MLHFGGIYENVSGKFKSMYYARPPWYYVCRYIISNLITNFSQIFRTKGVSKCENYNLILI